MFENVEKKIKLTDFAVSKIEFYIVYFVAFKFYVILATKLKKKST